MPLSGIADWILLLVRLMLAAVMLYHGWPKIKNLNKNAEDFVGMGFRPGKFWGTIVALTEVFGGVLLILGFFAWIPAVAFGFQMIVGTIWKITKTDKKFPDYSHDMILLMLCLVILAFGPGVWSLAF